MWPLNVAAAAILGSVTMPKEVSPKTTTASGRARVLPLFVALGILALASVAATQQFASALSYQAALGEPITEVFGVPVYQPLGWLKWFFQYRAIEHHVLDAAFAVAAKTIAGGLAISMVAAIFLRYLMTRDLQKVKPDLHGTAHWMPPEQIKASGLINSGQGVYIGGWTEEQKRALSKRAKKIVHYLRHNGPEHVLVFAPTRSGKGVGLVLPTLLSWTHSALVYDIKGEAWALTSGWRKSAGQRVLRFDPADHTGTAVCYNPLEEIRVGTVKEVADVQNLVTMIVDPDGKGLNDHWAKTGHALLVGAVLHVLYSGHKKTLAGVAEFLSDPSCPFEEALTAMLETEHDSVGNQGWTDSNGEPTLVHPTIAASARDMLNKADNERSGVLSTAMSFLSLYRDPVVAMNTARSEFKISDLMNHESPVSLYLVVRPSDQARLKPLTRLLINQIVRGLTEEMKFKDGRSVALYKHRLLLLMDEFPSLGKLEIFEEALAFMGGYGMKAYLITQDLSQLQKQYTRDENISSNTHIRVAFAPNKYETAKMLSDMVGTTTVVKATYSYSGKRSKTTLDSISAQSSEHARQLLTPDEIMRLRGPTKDKEGNITEAGDMLIFQAGFAPILGTQILYFRDPTFHERSLMPPLDQSDRIRVIGLTPSAPAPSAVPSAPSAAASASAGTTDDAEMIDHSDSPDDYEVPPLPATALIASDEEYPEAYDVPVDGDDETPPLGRELTLPAHELAAIPDDPDEDDADTAGADDYSAVYSALDLAGSSSAGNVEQAEARADPFLEMSRQWAVEPTADIDLPALEADEDSELEGAEGLPPGIEAEGDIYLAASRSWAGPCPPDTSDFGFDLGQRPAAINESNADTVPGAGDEPDGHAAAAEADEDPLASFALLEEMAAGDAARSA